jgi:hypothetical protein
MMDMVNNTGSTIMVPPKNMEKKQRIEKNTSQRQQSQSTLLTRYNHKIIKCSNLASASSN